VSKKKMMLARRTRLSNHLLGRHEAEVAILRIAQRRNPHEKPETPLRSPEKSKTNPLIFMDCIP
jgi:hypothetical protein